MSLHSISQVMQALLPGGHADSAGVRGDARLGALHADVSVSDRMSSRTGEANGLASDMPASVGQTLLDSLEMTPLQAQLGASLSETLGHVSALAFAPPALPAATAEVMPERPPNEGPQTLQHMAEAAPRHDIATERHRGAERDASPAAALAKEKNASAPAPSVRAEPLATPLAREAMLTTAVASLLHTPSARLRTNDHAHDPLDDALRRQRQQSGGDTDDAADEQAHAQPDDADDAMTPDLPTAPAIAASGAAESGLEVAPEAQASTAALTSDPLLYQQIVAALHARHAERPEVQVALDELKRQRRVVIATPVSVSSGSLRCAAHVDVLCPTLGGGRAWRFVGELLWSQAAGGAAWFETHLVKSQAQGHVRQLVPVDAQHDAREVAISLGAQAMPMTAWSQACLRVRDGNRLWASLDAQWSLRLVVARAPLVLSVQQAPGAGVFHAA
ncbi:MAG: hypothetical protein RLZZ618_822 [Pseudomonadota bacterium]|jgi:hypothetical protein